MNSLCSVIANKNQSNMLQQRLQSIVQQTVPFDEIIIIDDGSTDDSQQIIKQFKQSNEQLNIKILLFDKSKGFNTRMNEAFQNIESTYLNSGAADDYYLPNFCNAYKTILNLFPNIKIYTSISRVCNKNRTQDHVPSFPTCTIKGTLILESMKRYNFWIPSHCSILHTETVKLLGGLYEEFKWHSDMFLVYVMAMKYGIGYLALPLAIKTNTPDSYANIGYYSQEQSTIKQAMLNEIKKSKYEDIAEQLTKYIQGIRG